MKNTVEGGDSFWVDTFSAISEVREERPDYFDILCRVPIYHRFTPPGTDRYVRSHHTLVTMLGEDIYQISDNPWSTDTPLATYTLDLETRRQWWEAYLIPVLQSQSGGSEQVDHEEVRGRGGCGAG